MKNIKYLLLIIGVILAFQSCEDEDKNRFPEFEDAANMRIQIDPDYSSIDASDISNAKLVFSVFSENTNIESVVISAVYYSFQNDSTTAPVEVLSLSQSDFNAADGAIRNREFTAQFLAEKFGLPGGVSDLGGGDRFDFFNLTTLTNGMVFPDTILSETNHETVNVTPNIINSSGTTSFTVGFTAYVACSVPAGFALGDYMFEQIAGPADPFFGNPTRWASEVVTLTQVSPIERTFNGTYFTFDNIGFNFLARKYDNKRELPMAIDNNQDNSILKRMNPIVTPPNWRMDLSPKFNPIPKICSLSSTSLVAREIN